MGRKRGEETSRRLQALYSQRVRDACESAIENDGQAPAEAVENLERLRKLSETSAGSTAASLHGHAIAAVALLSTLTVSSILLLVHMRQTEIGLDLSLSEVAFSLDGEQTLAPMARLASFGASGLEKIELSDLSGQPGRTISIGDGSAGLLLALPEKQKGSIMVFGVALPAATRASLQAVGPQRYRLSMDPPQGRLPPFQASFEGPVRVAVVGEPAMTRQAGLAQATMYPAAGRVSLDFEVAPGTTIDLAQQWRINGLTLARLERFMDANRTSIRSISTLLSGTLYMDSLNSEQRVLRAGEAIRFEDSLGEVRRLSIEAHPISLQYQGAVRGMTTGFGETRTDLMPTVLEWLRTRHGISLLWGATLYVFGMVAAVLRWMKLLQ